jgi:hypothetical protein
MVDLWSILWCGGRQAVDLLEYSLVSVQLEILFGHLVAEYRNQPTGRRAIALYDVFCASRAPGRIHATDVLPPRDLFLMHAIERIRGQMQQVEAHNALQSETPMSLAFPGRHLFDTVNAAIRANDNPVIRAVSDSYDPALSPVENLPGRKPSPGQRMFIDRVWRPQMRPYLVQSGFPRLASIGG